MLPYESAAGRVAFIAQGGTCIGAAVALRLAEDGFRVIIADCDFDVAADTAGRIASWGWHAEAMHINLASPKSIDAVFDQIGSRYRRCDVLVNNADSTHICPFVDLPLDHWLNAMNLNVTGAMLCAQHAARLMKRPKWGRIVNVTPITETRVGEGQAAYVASKAAVLGLTRQMAVELAPFGITVNAISPGAVDTSGFDGTRRQNVRARPMPDVPMTRPGRPQEIASTVAFLASEDAAYVTGHVIPVDGGLVAAGLAQA